MKPHESDMTREGKAAYRAVERNIGAEYLERAARESEAVAALYSAADQKHLAQSGHYHPCYGALADALTRLAQRIRALKEE